MPAGKRARPTHAQLVGKLVKVKGTGLYGSTWVVGDLLGGNVKPSCSTNAQNKSGQVALISVHNGFMHLEFFSQLVDWIMKGVVEVGAGEACSVASSGAPNAQV